MVGVIVAGRLASRVDPRWLMFAGILLVAATLWEMTGWTPDIDAWSFSRDSMIQGFGLGIVFTPLQVVAFATLPAELRTDGTSLFSLLRNVGAGDRRIGDVGRAHAEYADRAFPDRRTGHAVQSESCSPAPPISSGAPPLRQALAALNAEVTRQAAIIAYVDDFKLLLLLCLPMLLLLLLMRRPIAANGNGLHEPTNGAAVPAR